MASNTQIFIFLVLGWALCISLGWQMRGNWEQARASSEDEDEA